METVLQRLSPGARIAIIRLRSLGDCVLTTPALSLLKNARPDLQVAVVVDQRFAPVFAGNPDVDRILPPTLSALSGWSPQLTLNLHGGARSVPLTLAGRSPIRAGFAHFRFQAIYKIHIPRAQEILQLDRKVHTAEHLASAVFYLGVPVQRIPRSRLVAEQVADHRPSTRPYAVLHPLASDPGKTWPAANFRALAAHIESNLGLEPVFIAGPNEPLLEFRPYRCLAGTSLEEIKSLLAGASLFVGNDSGPAHMAAAFGIPVLVLFGTSDPEIWGPWKTESSVLVGGAAIQNIPVSHAARALAGLAIPQLTMHNPRPR